ncbi:hypothetical protein PINS_up000321 [Pythium insidiosum]|nr:hypothetical protein PINS_up000321 [Pythium insidiosum]
MQAKRASESSVGAPRDASHEMATTTESREKKATASAPPATTSSSSSSSRHHRNDNEQSSTTSKSTHRGDKQDDNNNDNSATNNQGNNSSARNDSSKASGGAAGAAASRAASRPRSRSPSPSPRSSPSRQSRSRSPSVSGGSGGDLSDDEMSNDGRESLVAPAASTAASMADRRNSTMTLPSLSRAALMHINDRSDSSSRGHHHHHHHQGRPDHLDDTRASPLPSMDKRQYNSDLSAPRYAGGAATNDARYDRRNHSAADSGPPRWPRRDRDGDPIDRERDDMGSSHSGDGGASRGDDGPDDYDDDMEDGPPPSPGRDGHDVRIMFHGREISAIDLVGLRVAKTFVGHGRFLGQVVKFDERSSHYTIVYADGDAEELSIENTIQILIQDEIERADPSLPPLAVPYRSDGRAPSQAHAPESPGGNSTPVVPPSVPAPSSSNLPPPANASGAMPGYPAPRRTAPSISDREAQFVIGLFENHALPILLRQGWRVQSNASGTEQRFLAPPGNFRGAGRIFPSALDVVELIATDSEMLSLCFPQNVHSAILSLFPESTMPRKRTTTSTPQNDMDGYDMKRPRQGREDIYSAGGGVSASAAVGPAGPSMMRSSEPSGLGGAPGAPLPSRGGAEERLVPPGGYRGDPMDRDREIERDPYPPSRMPPAAPADRFGGASDYRRVSSSSSGSAPGGPGTTNGGDYRSMPPRSMPSDGGSRWPSGPPMGSREVPEYRRQYEDASGWQETADPMGRGGTRGYMGGRGSMPIHRGDPGGPSGDERGYYGDRGLPRASGIRAGGGPMPPSAGTSGADTPPMSYRGYRDLKPSQSGQYSPGHESFGHRYPSSREPPQPDYRVSHGASSSGGPPPPSMQDRFARSFGGNAGGGPPPSGGRNAPGGGPPGRGFSMMDVDRNSRGGIPSAGYDRPMGRGRSPHPADGGPPPPGDYASHVSPQHGGYGVQPHHGSHPHMSMQAPRSGPSPRGYGMEPPSTGRTDSRSGSVPNSVDESRTH